MALNNGGTLLCVYTGTPKGSCETLNNEETNLAWLDLVNNANEYDYINIFHLQPLLTRVDEADDLILEGLARSLLSKINSASTYLVTSENIERLTIQESELKSLKDRPFSSHWFDAETKSAVYRWNGLNSTTSISGEFESLSVIVEFNQFTDNSVGVSISIQTIKNLTGILAFSDYCINSSNITYGLINWDTELVYRRKSVSEPLDYPLTLYKKSGSKTSVRSIYSIPSPR